MTDQHIDSGETELDDLASEAPGDLEADEPTAHTVEDQSAPTDAEPAVADETSDVATLRAQRDEYLGHWQRAQADYQNLKRRSSTDLENRLRRTMEPLLRNLLLVVDHLDMALMSPTESQDAKNLALGVELVRRQMVTAMEESEVEPIPEGGTFDPERHQAVAKVEDADSEPDAVLETVRRGYLWRGRVLRPAEVRVATEPSGDGEEAEA